MWRGRGAACMAGGGGHAWWEEGMHGGRRACVVGGMYGGGRLCMACVAGEMATAADGTHPTGMHSCYRLQTKFAKVMFLHLSVILFRGGCLPQCMLGYTPPEQTPQGSRHPPMQCMLGDTGNKRAVRILLECVLVFTHKITCGALEIYLGENWILCSVVIVAEHFIGFQVLLNDLQLGFIST